MLLNTVMGISGVGVGGGGGFTYYSTKFDGVDDVRRGAALTGAADSKLGLCSFWLKMPASSDDATDYRILVNNNASFSLYRKGGGSVRLIVQDDAAGYVVWIDTIGVTTVLKADGWTHMICAWDTGTAGRGKMYKNGTDATHLDTFTLNALGDWNGATNWSFGNGDDGGAPDFLISEFYLTTPAAYFDLTNSANVQKFRSAGGAPVDLGSDGSTPTGTAPLIYMRNQVGGSPTWTTNQGTGGNFTVTGGAITDGGVDKP